VPLLDPPFLRTLESLVLLAGRLQTGRQAGERPAPRAGSSLEFRDYRSYAHGDDLRSVDWNVFARLDQLHVKQFAAERDLRVHVAVDVSASMRFFGKDRQALQLAAAVGYVALARGDTLSWAAFAERVVASGEGMRGKGRGLELLRGLDGAVGGGATRLEAAAAAGAAGLVVVVSDFCARDASEKLLALRPRGGTLAALHVVAADEIRPGVRGAVRLVDAESGAELDLDADALALDRYRAATSGRWDALQRFCARESVPYLRVLAGSPVRDAVAALLRPGGVLARR
jgi:uncharacterized protein (DUF58 family)